MNNFRYNLGNKIDKYIKYNNLTYMSFFKNDLGDISRTIKVGSTRFNILFDIAKFIDIDIRNLLMFNDNTYEFENSFETFEEFFLFIRSKFKNYRLNKGLKAIDIGNEDTIYAFENGRKTISLKKFYSYLDKLGMSSDEFFLSDEEYKILDNQNNEEVKNKNYIDITFKDIFNRVDELEKVRGIKIAKSVIPTRSMMPTVHVFLNICKSLKVSPSDFMDFDNKIPEYKKIEINNREYISNLRKTIQAESENSQKFLRLDNIFNYCNHNNIDVKLFLEEVNEKTNKNKELNIDRRNSL